MGIKNLFLIPPLQVGQCQVWWARTSAADVRLVSLLDPLERARWARFHHVQVRARYLVAHATARIILAAHSGVSLSELRFSNVCHYCGGAHGKPRLSSKSDIIDFSISYSGKRAVLAVARGIAVGVDVEHAGSQRDVVSLVSVALSIAERRTIARLAKSDQPIALLRYWVRKEALLKATGHGLAISPSDFTVTAPSQAPELLAWDGEPALNKSVWLHDLNSGPEYSACLAGLGRRPDVVERYADDLLANIASVAPHWPPRRLVVRDQCTVR